VPWDDIFANQNVLGTPNDPLVGPDDYTETFMLGDGTFASLSSLDQARVQTAIEVASAAVRTKTGQQLTQISETITLPASGSQVLTLPQFPVTAISSVTRDGATLDATAYSWVSPTGIITTLDGSRWLSPQLITVTYTHGWNPLPRDLAGVVLSKAKRWLDSPGGQDVQSETLGSWSVTYAQSQATGGFTLEEEDILSRYTLWTIAS
jgi:hypothetical protein